MSSGGLRRRSTESYRFRRTLEKRKGKSSETKKRRRRPLAAGEIRESGHIYAWKLC